MGSKSAPAEAPAESKPEEAPAAPATYTLDEARAALAEEAAVIAALHASDGHAPRTEGGPLFAVVCAADGQPWPCDAAPGDAGEVDPAAAGDPDHAGG